MKGNLQGSASGRSANSCSATAVSSTRWISGALKESNLANSAAEYSRKHTPGPTISHSRSRPVTPRDFTPHASPLLARALAHGWRAFSRHPGAVRVENPRNPFPQTLWDHVLRSSFLGFGRGS